MNGRAVLLLLWLMLLIQPVPVPVPPAHALSLTQVDQSAPWPGIAITRYRTSDPNTDVWVAAIDLCADHVRVEATGAPSSYQTAAAWGTSMGVQLATNGDFYRTGPQVYGDAVGGALPWPLDQTGLDPAYSGDWYYEHHGWYVAFNLDQGAASGWRELGAYQFAQGGEQFLALFDNTPQSIPADQHLAADAVRLTRLDAWCGDGSCDASANEDCFSCPVDCPAGTEIPGNGLDDDCDGVVDEEEDATATPEIGSQGGCHCTSGPEPTGPPLWLAALLLTGLVRRRYLLRRPTP